MGLGAANLVNSGVNLGLALTPTDFRFRTDMHWHGVIGDETIAEAVAWYTTPTGSNSGGPSIRKIRNGLTKEETQAKAGN